MRSSNGARWSINTRFSPRTTHRPPPMIAGVSKGSIRTATPSLSAAWSSSSKRGSSSIETDSTGSGVPAAEGNPGCRDQAVQPIAGRGDREQESHPLLAGAAGELSVHPIQRVAAPKLWGYARGDLHRLNAVDMKGRAMRIKVLSIVLALAPVQGERKKPRHATGDHDSVVGGGLLLSTALAYGGGHIVDSRTIDVARDGL